MTNEELRQEIEKLEQQIKDLKVKLEEKVEKKPYEVEVPEDIGNYYFVNECGAITLLKDVFFSVGYEKVYLRGLAFKTREEAEQFDKERILLFKLHKWAEEHNGGWKLNWEANEPNYYVTYDYYGFSIKWSYLCNSFIKLPYFKTKELAEQFIEEFGEEIKEVLL